MVGLREKSELFREMFSALAGNVVALDDESNELNLGEPLNPGCGWEGPAPWLELLSGSR